MAHRILMVEDDFALAMGTEYALASEGYEVATAGNLAQAREKYDVSVALVLLDVMLPDETVPGEGAAGTGGSKYPAVCTGTADRQER